MMGVGVLPYQNAFTLSVLFYQFFMACHATFYCPRYMGESFQVYSWIKGTPRGDLPIYTVNSQYLEFQGTEQNMSGYQ